MFKGTSFIMLLLVFGCVNQNSELETAKWKQEVKDAEKAFNNMAQEQGLVIAFEHYAAKDGAIRRGKKVITGKQAIREWYEKDVRPNETLTWEPTFVDVSASGDMAYTYGDYVFTSVDSLGVAKKSKGIFHTVWKRQTDGEWRFVWD